MADFLSLLDTATPIINRTGAVMVTIDGYPIDAVMSESHDHDAEVTDYPREQGADATDHVRLKPIKISLDCIVSDTPLGPLADHSSRQGDDVPSRTAYQRMVALRASGEPVLVTTSLAVFKNMVCSGLSVPRESGEPHQLHFRVEFTQADIVKNNRRRVAVSSGNGTKSRGEGLAKQARPVVMVFTVFFRAPAGSDDGFFTKLASTQGIADAEATGARLVLTDTNGDRHYEVNYPTTPQADGYVDQRGYHPYVNSLLFGSEPEMLAKYDPATGMWKNKKDGYVVKSPETIDRANHLKGTGDDIDAYNQGVLNYYNKSVGPADQGAATPTTSEGAKE